MTAWRRRIYDAQRAALPGVGMLDNLGVSVSYPELTLWGRGVGLGNVPEDEERGPQLGQLLNPCPRPRVRQ